MFYMNNFAYIGTNPIATTRIKWKDCYCFSTIFETKTETDF